MIISGKLYCSNNKNLCIVLVENSSKFNCLRCPSNYFNPGDDRCYSPDTMQLKKNNLLSHSDSLFSMKIEYVLEDICNGPSCADLDMTKCQFGYVKSHWMGILWELFLGFCSINFVLLDVLLAMMPTNAQSAWRITSFSLKCRFHNVFLAIRRK